MSGIETVVTESNNNFVDREQFDAELQKYYSGLCIENKKTEWTREKIQNVIQMIEEHNHAKILRKRPSDKQYYHAKKYEIINIGDEKVLILKRKSPSDPMVRLVPSSDFYQRIHDAHIETGHGRRDKIIYALKDKCVVPIWAINIFLQLCKTCLSKKSVPKRGIVRPIDAPSKSRPSISDDSNRRGQVDLIDFQSTPDEEYNWLLKYQDLLTKFCFLRPVKSKTAKEVAFELFKIFLVVGFPNILQSDCESEFMAAVLKEIENLWPNCKITIMQSQGSVERSNQDVKNMIWAWMVEHNSNNWSMGCYFAQFQINSSYDSAIASTPLKALFGVDPRLGLFSHISKKLETEEDQDNGFEDNNVRNDNLQNFEIHTNDEQQKVTEDDSENIVSNNSDMVLNTHEYPVIKEEINILNSEINKPEINEREKVPIPTVNNEIPILDQSIISILDKHDSPVVKKEIKSTNSTNEIENKPVVGNEIINPNNCDIVPNVSNKSTAIFEVPITLICPICNKETSGKIRCQKCNGVIHATCGVSNEDEGSSQKLVCNFCANQNSIPKERKESHQNLKRAAEIMKSISCKKFKDIDIGTTVLVEVPKEARGLLDGKNIIGKVIETRNELYRVGTPFGIISDWIPGNALLSPPNTILSGDIPEITLPLRTIVAKCTSFGRQGTEQCNCKQYNKKQCVTERCNCKKANVLCNFRCHKSLTCHNT